MMEQENGVTTELNSFFLPRMVSEDDFFASLFSQTNHQEQHHHGEAPHQETHHGHGQVCNNQSHGHGQHDINSHPNYHLEAHDHDHGHPNIHHQDHHNHHGHQEHNVHGVDGEHHDNHQLHDLTMKSEVDHHDLNFYFDGIMGAPIYTHVKQEPVLEPIVAYTESKVTQEKSRISTGHSNPQEVCSKEQLPAIPLGYVLLPVSALKPSFIAKYFANGSPKEANSGLPKVVFSGHPDDPVTKLLAPNEEPAQKKARTAIKARLPKKNLEVIPASDCANGIKGECTGPKIRRYSQALPSRFCHLCARSVETTNMVTCFNIRYGVCRKVICERCLEENGWKIPAGDEKFVCCHCKNQCPDKAQCNTYKKTNKKRRMNGLVKRKQLEELLATGGDISGLL